MQVHIGAEDIYLKDYLNVDIEGKWLHQATEEEFQANFTTLDNYFKYPFGTPRRDIIVDLKMNLLEEWGWQDNSIGRIVMISCLEHFSKQEGAHIISEIKRVLAPGGEAIIDVPNVKRQVDYFYESDPEWCMTLVYCNGKNPYSFHRYGYTEDTFFALWGQGYTVSFHDLIEHDYPMLQFKVIKNA